MEEPIFDAESGVPAVPEESSEEVLAEVEQPELSKQEKKEQAKEEEAKKRQEDAEKKAQKVAKKKKRAERRNTKAAKIIRRVAIWILVILVIFLAGYAISHFMVFRPANKALELTQAELTSANEEIDTLESEIERLSALETTNESLQSEIKSVNTHITILSARVAVSDAIIALHDGDLAEVSLKLDKVEETLRRLKPMLEEDQRDVVTTMQQRLDLVVGELDEDTAAAEMDLEVLASKLLDLENTLFVTP